MFNIVLQSLIHTTARWFRFGTFLAMLSLASWSLYAEEDPTIARILYPAPDTALNAAQLTFQWTTGNNVSAYRLAIGRGYNVVSGPPWADLFYYEGTATSATVSNLPTDGSTVYVRLWSKTNTGWRFNDYSYQTTLVLKNPAKMLTPTPGSTLSASSVTFQWDSGNSVSAYRITIGTNYNVVSGASWADLFYYEGTATSATASGLPTDGSTLYVRLWSKIDGYWQFIDYTYVTPNLAPAEMVSPAIGSILSSFSQTFTWSPGNGVSEYKLAVGTSSTAIEQSPGGDIYLGTLGTLTSVTVPGIPLDGSTVYVRLWSKIGATWRFKDYAYTTAVSNTEVVTMVTPQPGSTLTQKSATFSWTTSEPVELFRLAVATDPAKLNAPLTPDLYYFEGTGTSTTMTGVPLNGNSLYVRLWFRIQDSWFSKDYQYQAIKIVPAELIGLSSGSTFTQSSVHFQWNSGSGADEYLLLVATSPEIFASSPGYDIYYYRGTNTSLMVPVIPLNGKDVHVRLGSRFQDSWYFKDYSFHTVGNITGPGTYDQTMLHEGLTRSYRLHVPVGYNGQTRLPMVVVLHGNQGSAAEMEQLTGFAQLANQENFIVLYPEASVEYDHYWYDGRFPDYPNTINEVGFVAQLIDLVTNTISVDKGRIFVTGFSGGAALANQLGVFLSDRIAAIAPVAGTLGHDTARTREIDRPVPVMYLHGTADPYAFYQDGGSVGTSKGFSLRAVDLIIWWGTQNRVLANEEVSTLDAVDDDTHVVTYTYRNDVGTPMVVFHSIENGGHTWPGGEQWGDPQVIGLTSQEFDATRAIWEFFQRFSLDSEDLAAFTGYPFAWPPAWYGEQNLACQWARRGLASAPDSFTAMGYGEDSNVTYLQWGFPVRLPEGTKIYIEGEFPYARYFNFQVNPPWDPDYPNWRGGQGAQSIAIVDQDIEPDAGSVNPYQPGVDRHATNRRYRLEFELRSAPSEEWDELNGGAAVPPYRAPGNLRVGGHRSGRYGERGPYIEMRIYAPDGYEPYAGVDLPTVYMQLPGEERVLAPPVADLYRYPRGKENEQYWVKLPYKPQDNPCLVNGWAAKDQELYQKRQDYVKSVLQKPSPSVEDPLSAFLRNDDDSLWQLKSFGVARTSCIFQKLAEGGLQAARDFCPQGDLDAYGRGYDQPSPRNDEHTNGVDMYNSFLGSVIWTPPGELLVFGGKAQVTPQSLSGPNVVNVLAPVRYWSLCLYKEVVNLGCVMDETVPTVNGNFTIVVGAPQDRPSNAHPECGIAWMPTSARGISPMWRMKSTHKVPWQNALQNVPWETGDVSLATYDEGAVRNVMGQYYPEGRYMRRADVEAFGCSAQ